jgi:hypothetical protein
MSDDRDERGRFVAGNGGGPGRPRRAIEREYLAVISEAVSLDDWREIVAHAVDVAKQGDDKARAWLAKYVVGDNPITLTELLARELLDIDPDLEVLAKVDEISEPTPAFGSWDTGGQTLVERVKSIKARFTEQEARAEQERRKAERKAQKAAQLPTAPSGDTDGTERATAGAE